MAKTLGVYVSSDGHMSKLLRLCRAAKHKGVAAHVFLTHRGTRLVRDPRFEELTDLAEVAICRVGFEANGLRPEDITLDEKALATQMWHTEMLYNCDRYLTF